MVKILEKINVFFSIFWVVVLISAAIIGFEGYPIVALLFMGLAGLGSAIFASCFLRRLL